MQEINKHVLLSHEAHTFFIFKSGCGPDFPFGIFSLLYPWMVGKKYTISKLVCVEVIYTTSLLLTPLSDQERISPFNINTISSRQVTRRKIIN